MKKLYSSILVALLSVLITQAVYAQQPGEAFPLIEVEDGDTLIVEVEGKAERVQLLGIDAPENTDNAKFKLDLKRTGFEASTLLLLGNAATEYLKSLVSPGELLELQADLQKRDRYGRIPAIVIHRNGRDLAEEMILGGYAVALPSESLEQAYIGRFDRLERFSRKKGNGLWGSHAQTMNDWYNLTR